MTPRKACMAYTAGTTVALARSLATAGAAAQTYTLGFDPGTHHVVTPAMEDYTTLASDMAGMQMTVVQGGVSQLYTWGVLEDDFGTFYRGGVITDTFAIYATGDTWCPPILQCAQWLVQQLGFQPITQIIFHGAPGGVVFDLTTPPGDFGTPGSAQGSTFRLAGAQLQTLAVNAVYRNEVSVGANPVVGDLYKTLELNFAGNGLFGRMQFSADTDRIPPGAEIYPAIPEPASVALLLAGLAGLGLHRRHSLSQRGERA